MKRALAIAALLLLAACGTGQAPGDSMAATELVGRLQSGDVPIVLDVRTPEEYAAGHIPGAVNIPHDELEARIDEIAAHRGDELVVHCQSGKRAGIAEGVLHEAGFQRVLDLDGHWKQWQADGHPVE